MCRVEPLANRCRTTRGATHEQGHYDEDVQLGFSVTTPLMTPPSYSFQYFGSTGVRVRAAGSWNAYPAGSVA
jgi:hypothetical protein